MPLEVATSTLVWAARATQLNAINAKVKAKAKLPEGENVWLVMDTFLSGKKSKLADRARRGRKIVSIGTGAQG